MIEVFFDIRGNALKVLMTDGESVKYARIFDAFSPENTADAQKILRQISDESGVKPDSVNLVPPAGEVKIRTYKLQKMALEDAKMIVRRKIIAEEGLDGPVFHLMPYGQGERHQEFIATIVVPERLQRYITLFSAYGTKIKNLSPSFHAKLKAFERLQSEIPQTCAIFEVGTDAVEIIVISASGIITHETAPVTQEKTEGAPEEPDIERTSKKRLYAIIDALYKFKIYYGENFADTPIEKVLLCGMADNAERTAGAVEEAIGAQTSLWDPFAEGIADGPAYTALYGFSKGVSDGTAVNLLSAELLRRGRPQVSRNAILALACIYLFAITVAGFMTETRYSNLKKMLQTGLKEKQELAGGAGGVPELKESLQRLAVNQTPLYGIFRYLADNLPEGVFLDGIVFKQNGGDEILQMSFVSKYDVNAGQKKYFTTVIDSLGNSGSLTITNGPVFSVSGDAKNSLIHFEITCKVINHEK